MQLPIDFRSTHFPIKAKYIDDETAELSCWMVFGAHDDGTVDVCDAQGNNVFTRVRPELARRIVEDRNAWVRRLLAVLNDYPTAVECVKEWTSATHPEADYGKRGVLYTVVDVSCFADGTPAYLKLRGVHGSIGEPEWLRADRFRRVA